jgi:hypothetical protein
MRRCRALIMLVLPGLVLPLLSACSSASPAVRVADVVHIGRYTQMFAGPLPASPAQAAVVEGFREGQVLWNKSASAQRLVPPVRDYVTGEAFTRLAAVVRTDRSEDLVPAGVDRFFMTRVTAITGSSAIVATCDDGSAYAEENPRTRKVDVNFLSSPGQAYLFETWRMAQLSGHWAISDFTLNALPSRSAEACQPGISGSGPARWPQVSVLLRQMSAAMNAASSVHVSGTVTQSGKTVGLNLAITSSGGYSGQISEDGAAVTVLVTHGHSYLKLSAAFLRASHLPTTICNLYCGKYLPYPASQAQSLLSGLTIASMTGSVASAPPGQVKLLGAVTLGGQLAWLLSDQQGDSAFVAAHGKPYLLQIAAPPGDGSLTMTQWNAVQIPPLPPASQIVSISQLMA